MVDIYAQGSLLGIDNGKSMEGVVTNHQCLPASYDKRPLTLEGSSHFQVKYYSCLSLQIMVYSHQGHARTTKDRQEYGAIQEQTGYKGASECMQFK